MHAIDCTTLRFQGLDHHIREAKRLVCYMYVSVAKQMVSMLPLWLVKESHFKKDQKHKVSPAFSIWMKQGCFKKYNEADIRL